MLFHAFRVVYTVKELDSNAKHRQCKKTKNNLEYTRVFLCQKSHFWVRTSFKEFFSNVALSDVKDGGTLYMGISPGRTHPCTNQPDKRARARPSTRFIRLHCC